MITFTPIHKRIQKTLYQKIDMLKKDVNLFSIGSNMTKPGPNGEVRGEPNENYMMARSTWTRATSLAPDSDGRPLILMGGELNSGGNMASAFSTAASHGMHLGLTGGNFSEYDMFHDRGGKYSRSSGEGGGEQPYRPMPGIKDISVEYRGGGMTLGATRTSEINWTCWTWEELDRLQQHFLAHGKTVFLEWGWTGVNNKIMLSNPYPLFKRDDDGFLIFNRANITRKESGDKKSLSEKISEYILNQNGHYDAMLGKIQNFTWTVRDDGGFDCVTTLVSTGMSALQKTFKSEGDANLATLPTLVDEITNWSDSIGANRYGDYLIKIKVDAISKTLGESTAIKKKRKDNKENWNDDVSVTDVTRDFAGEWKKTGKRNLPSEYFRQVSPYINFKNYMADLPDQLYYNFLNNENTRKSGAILRVMDFAREFDGEQRIVEVGGYEAGALAENASGNSKSEFYCTWGWLEDNVLSRFFSDIVDIDGRVEGIFRSLDYKYDDDTGEIVKELKDKDGKVIPAYPQSVKIRSAKKLWTVDTSKWLLIKDDDLSTQIKHLVKYKEEGQVWGSSQGKASGKEVDPLAWRFSPNSDDSTVATKYGVCTEDEGFIRNVYFHGMYLRDKMIEADTMESAIMSVWNEFAAAYGGVHQFKIEFEDDGNHIVIRDTGQQGDTVANLIKQGKTNRRKEDGEDGDMNGLFEFPIWENGSIVKSQNLNAKLPSRMQMAAMYGSQNVETDESESQRTNDELAGQAWGKLFSPDDEDMSEQTLESIKRKKYHDMVGGKIDYPSKLNRSFGVANANPTSDLHVGNGKGDLEAPVGGTLVYPSIFQEIFAQQGQQLSKQMKKKLEGADGEIKDTRGWWSRNVWNTEKEKAVANKAKTLEEAKKKFKNTATGFLDMYEWVELGSGVFLRGGGLKVDSPTQSGKFGNLKIRGEYRQSMKAYFRGDVDGLANKTDPIIPVELEMEIDGTGGIFPGNAFQSSYLPRKYKERTCFQVVGASHKVDTTGWTTTVKGQIRVGMRQEIAEDDTVDKPIITNQGAMGDLGGEVKKKDFKGAAAGVGVGVLAPGDAQDLAIAISNIPEDENGNVPYLAVVNAVDQGDYIETGVPKFGAQTLRDEYGIEPVKWGPYFEGMPTSRPHATWPGPMGAPYNGIMFQVGNSFWTITGEPLEVQVKKGIVESLVPIYEYGGSYNND
jgi:hypothetical protein